MGSADAARCAGAAAATATAARDAAKLLERSRRDRRLQVGTSGSHHPIDQAEYSGRRADREREHEESGPGEQRSAEETARRRAEVLRECGTETAHYHKSQRASCLRTKLGRGGRPFGIER